MSHPINVGFIGLSTSGWAAHNLAPALLTPSLKDTYKLTAISTSNAESAAISVTKWGAASGNPVKAFHGPSNAIANEADIDLVAISIKAPLHKEAVIPVIESGRNFFLEWPAGKNLEETEAIRAAAHRKGVKAFVGLQARASATIQKIKQLVDEGAIGSVLSSTFIGVVPTEVHMWTPVAGEDARYMLDASNGVTPIVIMAGHQLDPITYTLGRLTSVTASSSQLHSQIKIIDKNGKETGETFPSQFSDHITFSGQLENGAHSSFVMRFGGVSFAGRKTLRWEIEGDKGSILVESGAPAGAFMNVTHPYLYLNGKTIELEGVTGGTYDSVGILVDQWKAYAKAGHYATIDDAVSNRRVLDAVETSAREGRKVEIRYD